MAAFTIPSSVPIHSRWMGTSRCSTVATSTSGGACGVAADVLVVHAAVINNAMANRAVDQTVNRYFNRFSIFLLSLLSLLERPRFLALEVFEKVLGVNASRYELGTFVP